MHRSLGGAGAATALSLRTLPGGGATYDGKIAGLYDLEETLGRGHFAVVKLARHVFTGEKVAVKVIDKSKLDEVSKAHLFQEVRCMKLVQHPHVVRLYEVIDTATKLYLILELGDGGDLYDYIMRHDAGLSEQLAREYFRQIVTAISYCHQLHVVHRDLKPENVVFFEKLGVVKLTDFGFSNKFCPGQKLETSCGSLAYSAPEILLGDSYDAPAVDVWSLGVILYMLVCGQAPFQEANDSETLTMIMDCKYSVPSHISQECKDLIARMLVRAPEKRATLAEIAAHPWLAVNKQDNQQDVLPLVSKEQLTDDDHNLIVQKIVNGNIATKEEIQESLDRNEYNHITATYFLLAERKLRSKRQDHVTKNKRPEKLAVPQALPVPKHDMNKGASPCLLSVPRTPGDLPQRSRKCSIVQEDEEEEDISNCSGREELVPTHCSLNRRGSRSEGRLNLALQERLAEAERRKPTNSEKVEQDRIAQIKKLEETRPKSAEEKVTRPALQRRMGKSSSIPESNHVEIGGEAVNTTIITESSTITIPVVTNSTLSCQVLPKYKTMPSPTRSNLPAASPLQLNEIFEEGDALEGNQRPSRQFVSRAQNRTTYEQRRSKFHKNRTASCSSSDASDDDSENRKKRAHKLNTTSTTKPLQKRRDSHDDSSDSQEPGTGGGGGGGGARTFNNSVVRDGGGGAAATEPVQGGDKGGGGSSGGGRKNADAPNVVFCKRHKSSRRRNGETRLRESQSLNRITEVQEDTSHTLVIAATVTQGQNVVVAAPKVKSFGARILQGFSSSKKTEEKPVKTDEKSHHLSRKDGGVYCVLTKELVPEKSGGTKKIRLLGKYFQVHKRLCIPIPGLFTKNRLYKAQSCGSLARDRVSLGTETVLRCRQRAVSVIRTSIGSDGDINQNTGQKSGDKRKSSSTVVQLNNVCNELTGICAVHLGQASKCCSFC